MITDENSYFNKIGKLSIATYKNVTDLFIKDFEKAITLDFECPIFLDTNILLRYYSISFKAREKLYDFLESKKRNIYLTSQVQQEFLRNREDVINRYFEQVSKKVPKEFNNEIVNKLQNFIEQHKIILKDYPYVEKGIEKSKNNLEEILLKLNKETDEKYTEFKNLIWNDKFLNLLSEFQTVDELKDTEIKIIKSHFESLRSSMKENNIENYLNKPNFVFPGMCDIKEKPENPYGDYIIFHEIMKFMKDNDSYAIFLTFDNSKGDWMSKSKGSHLHYVYNMFLNTNKILYVVDAERTLEKLLDVKIDSLINNEVISTELSVDDLNNIFKSHEVFRNVPIAKANNKLLKELILNDYLDVNMILQKLDNISPIISFIRNDNLNTHGILRFALRITDNSYTKYYENGNIQQVSDDFMNLFEKYRLLL